MHFRNRVKELRLVPANTLQHHPHNWRTHSKSQQNALTAMLESIGMATAVVAYEKDGQLRLIDGHLRTDLAAETEIPVLVLDVSADEADQLLMTLDPIAAMAGVNETALHELLATVDLPTGTEKLEAILEKHLNLTDDIIRNQTEAEIDAKFQVVAECTDESTQKALFEQLTADGFRCRILTT